MTEPEARVPDTEPDPTRQGIVVLGALGIAMLLVIAAGAVGVTMAMRGGTHMMTWGGTRAQQPVAVQAVPAGTAVGFRLDGLPSTVVEHYHVARANPDVYQQVPCFCGCSNMLGHRNLEECFVTSDGAWESHASGCQVCVNESQMVMQMMSRGMGPQMMRERIIAAFGGPMMG